MLESADNPTTKEKAELGYLLFFDKRMSKDGSMACVSCHFPERAWTDGKALSVKVGGAQNKRNAPSVQNLGYHRAFYWDGRKPSLESVSQAAWVGQLGAEPTAIAKKLNEIAGYKSLFRAAFGGDASEDAVSKALAAFLRALKSGNSPFDRFSAGDQNALGEAAQRGWRVFMSSGCVACHTPPLFSDGLFHNVGIGAEKPEAQQDLGRHDATKDAADKGKFKTPSLRDVASTGPYFHDGSAPRLEDAIAVMAAGGKPNANLDALLKPQALSAQDRADLKTFLESLTGTATFTRAPAELPR
jgi:cytochrome c peroxidase